MHVLSYWLIAVNIIAIVITIWDKLAAINGAWRIQEKTLFLLCILGGCPGMYLTMQIIRHKTLHKRFMIGIPLIFLAQLALCFAVSHFILPH